MYVVRWWSNRWVVLQLVQDAGFYFFTFWSLGSTYENLSRLTVALVNRHSNCRICNTYVHIHLVSYSILSIILTCMFWYCTSTHIDIALSLPNTFWCIIIIINYCLCIMIQSILVIVQQFTTSRPLLSVPLPPSVHQRPVCPGRKPVMHLA